MKGSISVVQAWLLGPLPLALLAWIQDWYVDVNAPNCATGTGTQADPFCNVMDAVAAASDGDTIHIAPGTFLENVVIDEDVSLIGTGGDQVTILDGMANGSVVRVDAANVSLTGLTLTNGSSSGLGVSRSYYVDIQVDVTSCTITGNTNSRTAPISCGDNRGGGIAMLAYGSLRTTDSTISNNVAEDLSPLGQAEGGGIFAPGAYTVITDSVVSANVCRDLTSSYSYAFGGGISASSLTLTNSTVSGNECRAESAVSTHAYGGGIFAGELTLESSEVSGNSCQSYGPVFENAAGGGILAFDQLVVTNSSVVNNACLVSLTSANSVCRGGGIGQWFGGGVFGSPATPAEVSNTVVRGNVSTISGGGIAAEELSLVNSTISGNAAGVRGGGVLAGASLNGQYTYWYGLDHVSIVNTSLSSNAGGGLAIAANGSCFEAQVHNSILWDNGVAVELVGCATVTVGHSLVQGGWPGVRNLDTDPLFVDPMNGDLRLLQGSPCVDAGDNSAVPPEITTDFLGLPRFGDDPLTPDTGYPFRWRRTGPAGLRGTTPKRLPVVDLGAFEGGI